MPDEWAEANLSLPSSMSAEPGLIRLDRTPYLRGILRTVVDPGVEEITFVSGTQVGKTTVHEILLGYWADVDPGPTLFVKPNEESTTEYIKERIRPLLEKNLRNHLSERASDNTLSSIKLDSMPIYFGWAGSPQSLASRPCRNVLPDECDKFPKFSGREADPISLAKERTATFGHRRRIILSSTPTTRDGAIWLAWEASGDRRHYFVPCPHCGKYQQLLWSQVKWPKLTESDKIKRADEIERSRLAWYECSNPECKGRIEDSNKPRMLEQGKWLSEGQAVGDDGQIVGDRPVSKRVGFHLSSLYSPWRTFAEMAAEFIRADGDIALTMNFRNSRLAEPFETQIATTDIKVFRAKAESGTPRNVVPDWAVSVLATADVQQDHLYYVIRAWGYGFRSQLLRFGMVFSFADLWAQCFEVPSETSDRHSVFPELLMIDGKYRTTEVLEFQKRDPTRIIRSRGLPHHNGPMHMIAYEQGNLAVLNINTLLSKDRLNQMLCDGDPKRWGLYADIEEAYISQMYSEHRIWDPKAKRELWKPKTSGRPNHAWDCEANQCALAAHRHLDIPIPAEPVATPRREPSNWMPDRPSNWIDR